jgi:hypothetical protein
LVGQQLTVSQVRQRLQLNQLEVSHEISPRGFPCCSLPFGGLQ